MKKFLLAGVAVSAAVVAAVISWPSAAHSEPPKPAPAAPATAHTDSAAPVAQAVKLVVFKDPVTIGPATPSKGGGQFIDTALAGEAVRALTVKAAENVDAIKTHFVQLNWDNDQPFGAQRELTFHGGPNGTPLDLQFPAAVLVGLDVNFGTIVDFVRPYYARWNGRQLVKIDQALPGAGREKTAAQGNRTTQLRCPEGKAVIGVDGRAGIRLDNISLICATPSTP